MKFLKPFLLFILSVLAVTAVLSLLMPTRQKIERSVTISAPAPVIYQALIKLENFNKYFVWNARDTSIKYTFTGEDGTPGASTSWSGDPGISGEGKIEITGLEENRSVSHKLSFTQPKKGTAVSSFSLQETNGITTVTWDFELATPRPWNIFNLFFSLDKKMGKDFEESLSALKTVIEKLQGTASSRIYRVEPMNFPATTFATIRQVVKWGDIPAFYAAHFPVLYEETIKANANPGAAASLFYAWNEKDQQADLAAALPVTAGIPVENNMIRMVDIPASKAVYVNYYGAYDKMSDAYTSIRKYLADNKLDEKVPSIEQYINDPAREKDTSKWLTKIVFLVK